MKISFCIAKQCGEELHIPDHYRHLSENEIRNMVIECIHSPDDGGYYLQHWRDNRTSQIAASEDELWALLDQGEIHFE